MNRRSHPSAPSCRALWCYALLAALCLAHLTAFACSSDGYLLLAEIHDYAAARGEAEPGDGPDLARAYRRVARVTARCAHGQLTAEIGNLRTAATALAGPLSNDDGLRMLVTARTDETDAALSTRPADVESELTKVGRAKDRDRVKGIRDAAVLLQTQGQLARDALDERAALTWFAKSSRKFDAAIAKALRIVKGQGGPLPQFKARDSARQSAWGSR